MCVYKHVYRNYLWLRSFSNSHSLINHIPFSLDRCADWGNRFSFLHFQIGAYQSNLIPNYAIMFEISTVDKYGRIATSKDFSFNLKSIIFQFPDHIFIELSPYLNLYMTVKMPSNKITPCWPEYNQIKDQSSIWHWMLENFLTDELKQQTFGSTEGCWESHRPNMRAITGF